MWLAKNFMFYVLCKKQTAVLLFVIFIWEAEISTQRCCITFFLIIILKAYNTLANKLVSGAGI